MIKFFKHLLIGVTVLNFLLHMTTNSDACSREDAEKGIDVPLSRPTSHLSAHTDFREKDESILLALDFELLVHITSFIKDQRDLLRLGLSTTAFRKACHESWKTRCLDLSRRVITKEDLNCIISGSYPDVNLSRTTICCKEISDFLLKANLHKLSLSHCIFSISSRSDKLDLDDEEAEILAKNKYIKILRLSWNQITDVGAKTLALNLVIEDLNLYHNAIGSEGAEALLSSKTLKVVDLRRNSLSGDELERLSNYPTTIKKLQLKYFSK